MNNYSVKIKNVNKKFKRGRKLLLKEALLDLLKPASTENFYALKNVSFEIKKGETFGILGPNGSGKSTLLKLISRIMVPTSGMVETEGVVAPLIELGAGFHPELSGRENIFLNASILGLKEKEIKAKYKDIVEFAELEDFIDTPIKHYSSGMYMRLGFSIAMQVNPDILLVDEILAVGDKDFQKKCLAKIDSLRKRGMTVVFISHDMESVKRFCDRAMVIDEGKVKYIGKTQKAISFYEKEVGNKE